MDLERPITRRRFLRASTALVAGLATARGASAAAAKALQAPASSRLLVLGRQHPRAFFFRQSEALSAAPSLTFGRWNTTFDRLMGIVGKALNEEIPARAARNVPNFTEFKRLHPDELVLLHFNGHARDPDFDRGEYFSGHWLYHNGSRLTADVPAHDGEAEIRVQDARLFRMYEAGAPLPAIGLCRLDRQGRPDWSFAEQVQLLVVDTQLNTIRVRRGAFGTTPKAFAAGEAYAAQHVTHEPSNQSAPARQWGLWAYNFSTTCPRDSRGRACADVLLEELLSRFGPGGPLRAFDGIEFDSMRYSLEHVVDGRGPDVDADGLPDGGVVGGVNAFGLGVIDFCRRLRDRFPADKLVLADGGALTDQRAFGILNGIESEGWPHTNDPELAGWSAGINRQTFWISRSRPPRLSYINHKLVGNDGRLLTDLPIATTRLVIAAAALMDCGITYMNAPPPELGETFGVWDELRMGRAHVRGWLGAPVAAAVPLAERTRDLLGDLGTLESLVTRRISGPVTVRADGAALRISPAGRKAKSLEFTLTLPTLGPDLVAVVGASAASLPGAPGVARIISLASNGEAPSFSSAWIDGQPFAYRHYRRDVTGNSIPLTISVEGPAPISLYRLSLYAYPDVWYREFEHGLVVANPSLHPYTLDLAATFPSARWRRLQGSPRQDPHTNDGRRQGPSLTVGPRNAIFLVRD